jgi:hypothetical protein
MTGRLALALATVVAALACAGGAGANHDPNVAQLTLRPDGSNGSGSFLGANTDGTRVFFETSESLASTDTDSANDIYERSAGTTTHISRGQINGNEDLDSTFLGASADGTKVWFETREYLVSSDMDLCTGSAPGCSDIYERSAGTTTLVSQGQDFDPYDDFHPEFGGASADGQRVFFVTYEQLASSDQDDRVNDVYQRSGGSTVQISQGQIGGNCNLIACGAGFLGVSTDGTRVFFTTTEQLTITDVDSQYDIYERAAGSTTQVSRGQINGNQNYDPTFVGTSQDGTRVFFETYESLASTDTDFRIDIYERSAGTTKQVSRGQINGNQFFDAFFERASADGTRVFFYTDEPLASTDTDSVRDVYQRSGTTTTHVSRGQINGNGPYGAFFQGISEDGTRLFFGTNEALASTDLDSSGDFYERSGTTTTHITRGQINGNDPYGQVWGGVSLDGTRVFFTTIEALASTDTDSHVDAYERTGGATYHLSQGNGPHHVDIGIPVYPQNLRGASTNGRRIFFMTNESLASTDTDSSSDIYRAAAFPLASYPTPARADLVSATLVPAYRQTISSTQCSTRGGTPKTHGPPNSLVSCDPPALLPGTAAFFGRTANGTVAFNAVAGSPHTVANEADYTIAVNLDDVRGGTIQGVDYNPNATGADVTLSAKLRISDLYNGGAQDEPGTVMDFDFDVPVTCSATTAADTGAVCAATTSANAVTGGTVVEGRQAVVNTFRVRLDDSGNNGIRGDSDDKIFAQQGLYTP